MKETIQSSKANLLVVLARHSKIGISPIEANLMLEENHSVLEALKYLEANKQRETIGERRIDQSRLSKNHKGMKFDHRENRHTSRSQGYSDNASRLLVGNDVEDNRQLSSTLYWLLYSLVIIAYGALLSLLFLEKTADATTDIILGSGLVTLLVLHIGLISIFARELSISWHWILLRFLLFPVGFVVDFYIGIALSREQT